MGLTPACERSCNEIMRTDKEHSPISASAAKRLFADWRSAPTIIRAVSGGPDSIALMWLAARWRRALARGPRLVAITVDHGLRAEAAREAREVKRLARSLDLPHRTLRWNGAKPKTGLPAAARAARYRLLAQAARQNRATHILTAHTRDDQAETLLMRLLRGSGIAGLAAVEVLVDGAERYLALRDRLSLQSGVDAGTKSFDAKAFAAMAEEIRLRLLLRAINQVGHEGPAELGKVEALLTALDRAAAESAGRRRPRMKRPKLKQTLAGALVSLVDGRIRVEPAPSRRRSG